MLIMSILISPSLSLSLSKVAEDDRKKKRMERFNVKTTELPDSQRKKQRMERFGAS